LRTNDIFTRITKYNQPENRFTASLVFLLEYLWGKCKDDETGRSIYCTFLNNLCNKESLPWGRQINFNIQPYEKGEDGKKRTYDFNMISPDNVIVAVEVKDTARISQVFKNDKKRLRKQAKGKYAHNCLVLLRRNYVSKEEREGVDSDVRWSELSRWLREIVDKDYFEKDSVAYYLLIQFLNYLDGKGVVMIDKINMDHIQTGLADFINFLGAVKSEAQGIFEGENLNNFETECGYYYSDENKVNVNYCGFSVLSGRERKKAYAIHLEDSHPKQISMALYDDYLDSKGRQFIKAKVKDYYDDGTNAVWFDESLETVYQKTSSLDQQDEIGRILKEMYQRFKRVTRNKL